MGVLVGALITAIIQSSSAAVGVLIALAAALITIPFVSSGKIVNKRNVISLFLAAIISITGYWIAEVIIFGNAAVAIASIVSSSIQAICSGVLFVVFGFTLDKMNFKSKLS